MRPSSMVALAAFSAWPSTCPPNTCGLPVSRLWPRNRLTSSRSSSNCCWRSARSLSIPTSLSAELERALHHGPVAGKAAEERVRLTLLQRRGREGDAGALAAAHDLGVRDHARIALLDVVVGESRAGTVTGDARHVGGLGQYPVVAHGLGGQLAGVMQRQFDLRAIRRHRQLLFVELHGIRAGDLQLAHLVRTEGMASDGEQGTQCEGSESDD